MDEYNQVIVTRTVYRAEQLRFRRKATFGGTVENVDTSAQLTGDVTDARDFRVYPQSLCTNYIEPQRRIGICDKDQVSKIINTIAPISHSLMEQKLVKNIGTDGKIVAPTDADIASMVERTVDLDTFETMKGLLGNAVRNAFYGSSDMSKIRIALE